MRKQKSKQGVITVEAALILPVFIMVMLFIINLINLFYFHLVMQQALNNTARILAQYGYVIDATIGIKNLELKKETKETEEKLITQVEGTVNAATDVVHEIQKGFNLSTLGTLIEKGEKLGESLEEVSGTIKDLVGTDGGKKKIINYLLISAMNGADDDFVKWMIGDYFHEMQVSLNSVADLDYQLHVENGTDDIILIARYRYDMKFFVDNMYFEQTVRVHPWIGN